MSKKIITGFSLLELIVVIAIFAVLSAIALPTYQQLRPNIVLNSTARQIASDLRYAQQLAVTEQIVYSVVFNRVGNSYQIIKSSPQTTIRNVQLKPQVSMQSITGLTDNTVDFNAAGAASESGDIVVVNTNNRSITVEIKPSGYVKIQN